MWNTHTWGEGFSNEPEIKYSCHLAPLAYKVQSDYRLPWKDNRLQWMIMNWGEDLHPLMQIIIIKDAFERINHLYYPLRFESTDDKLKVDIPLYWVSPGNEVKSKTGAVLYTCPFDFSANPEVIAVAYPYRPGFKWSMHVFINDNYLFTVKKKKGGKVLLKVLIHELFHAVAGLGHTTYPKDIMLDEYDDENDITIDTITAIQTIHGVDRLEAAMTDEAAVYIINSIGKGVALRTNHVLVKQNSIWYTMIIVFLVFIILLIW